MYKYPRVSYYTFLDVVRRLQPMDFPVLTPLFTPLSRKKVMKKYPIDGNTQ